MKIVTIIPAHLASIRLPRKILMPIQGIPMIEHVRRRAKLSKKISQVFVINIMMGQTKSIYLKMRISEAPKWCKSSSHQNKGGVL